MFMVLFNIYTENFRIIFGYMGLTYTLDVKNQGHDVKEFVNGFCDGRVLYGFVRVVVDSAPAKFVLIAWQGEGSSESFKMAYTRHVDTVKRLCRTVHLTIQARSETDLDWCEIVAKVRSLTGTVCSTRGVNSNDSEDDFIPKGSVYERANPNQDIPKGCVSRSVWQSYQQKQLQQQDSSKAVSPLQKSKPLGFIRPICQPETSHNHNGDKNNGNHLESENRPHNLKQAPQNEVTTTIKNRIKALESKLPSTDGTSGYRKVDPRAEIMLARQLSNSTSLDDKEDDTTHVGACYKKQDPRSEILAARAYKQAHQSVFQSIEPIGANYKRPDFEAEIRAARSTGISVPKSDTLPLTTTKAVNANGSSNQSSVGVSRSSQNNLNQPSLQQQKCLPSSPLSLSPVAHISNNQSHFVSAKHMNNNSNNHSHNRSSVSRQNSVETLLSPCLPSAPGSGVHHNAKNNQGLKAVCLYDYMANEEDEISFHVGDEIVRIEQIDEGWWLGQNAEGQFGLFPANYVGLLA
ncbi:unnamed protein product [Heterobilharzia americana]|nr:unnamed protein product [Heterobilharzia americana]